MTLTTIPAVQAIEFETRKVYQSEQRPSYTSWVSLFPGEHGQWYIALLEVTRPEKPLPPCTRQHWYEMSFTAGYDMSQYLKEIVLLESQDGMKTWEVISRYPCHHHEGVGTFAHVRTRDGRFLRFVWSCYSDDLLVEPNEILYRSGDNGKTWERMPPFHHAHFVSYPHRLRTLRDGTFVLCLPLAPRWGQGTDYPVRAATRLDVVNDLQMTLCFSHDQGQTWSNPLPIYGGQNVTETDFVELPDRDLLFFNNSIFANPGRQFVYREGARFTPGPLERVHSGTVPETVCLTEDGILVGCMRPGAYFWSDDLGRNWQPLEGVPRTMEVYQPWMHFLGDGQVVCAGHYGADDPVGGRDQYISIHAFRVEVLRKTKGTRLWIERDFDERQSRYLNTYTISLTTDGVPLADKEVQVWYVERDRPGYDSRNSTPLEERMKMGGKLLKVRTGSDGRTHVDFPEFGAITDIHFSYQIIAHFNMDRVDPDYKPTQLPQLEFYAYAPVDSTMK